MLTDDRAEIHLITSSKDLTTAAWGLRSFYYFSNERYKLCIHEDGTLVEENKRKIYALFPGCRIIGKSTADSEVLEWLRPFPRCQVIRKTKFISMKEFDFNYYLNAPIGILFDSDLMFFRRPDFVCDELVGNLRKGNWVNRDLEPGLSITSNQIASKFSLDTPAYYNTGFGTWHKNSILNEDLEFFLSDIDVLNHPWRFEQTLHALCSSKSKANLLPSEYDVYRGDIKENPVMRHYVGEIRNLFYSEAIPKVISHNWQ